MDDIYIGLCNFFQVVQVLFLFDFTFGPPFVSQVAGPIVFRVDSRVSLNSAHGKQTPHVEDIMYGLSYSFRLLQSGKILAWYSPKRNEAMVELRFFEF